MGCRTRWVKLLAACLQNHRARDADAGQLERGQRIQNNRFLISWRNESYDAGRVGCMSVDFGLERACIANALHPIIRTSEPVAV